MIIRFRVRLLAGRVILKLYGSPSSWMKKSILVKFGANTILGFLLVQKLVVKFYQCKFQILYLFVGILKYIYIFFFFLLLILQGISIFILLDIEMRFQLRLMGRSMRAARYREVEEFQ